MILACGRRDGHFRLSAGISSSSLWHVRPLEWSVSLERTQIPIVRLVQYNGILETALTMPSDSHLSRGYALLQPVQHSRDTNLRVQFFLVSNSAVTRVRPWCWDVPRAGFWENLHQMRALLALGCRVRGASRYRLSAARCSEPSLRGEQMLLDCHLPSFPGWLARGLGCPVVSQA